MKRDISELLQDAYGCDMDLEQQTPLSARRIKAQTMNKVSGKKPIRFRAAIRVAAIAAVIAVLMCSVYAADSIFNDGDWFGGILGLQLSQDQKDSLDDFGKTFDYSVSYGNITFTPIAAIADEHIYYLRFAFTAKDGIVKVNRREAQHINDITDWERLFSISMEYPMGEYSKDQYSYTLMPMADANLEDGTKEFVIKVTSSGDLKLNSGFSKSLCFNMSVFFERPEDPSPWWNHRYDDPYYKDGIWAHHSFQIYMGRYDDKQRVEVDASAVTYFNEEYDYTVAVNKMSFSPFTVTIDYFPAEDNEDDLYPVAVPFVVVMKDGSIAEYIQPVGVDQFGKPTYEVMFVNPVAVDNIDYILFVNGQIVDVN